MNFRRYGSWAFNFDHVTHIDLEAEKNGEKGIRLYFTGSSGSMANGYGEWESDSIFIPHTGAEIESLWKFLYIPEWV